MFAIALWDRARERLVLAARPARQEAAALRAACRRLARVRVGDEGAARAAGAAARARPRPARRVPRAAVRPALRACARSRRCRPARYAVVESGAVRVERYWSPSRPATASHDERDWVERVRDEVTAAVRRRLVADVPLGALLSGGIDSSIVVAAMAQASAEPVRTFTVGFPDARYDERAYARAVAERYGTRHEELEIDPAPGAARAARARLRRAVRRRGGAADAARLRGDAAARQGRARRRRRRRGVRRLRALPRRMRSPGACPGRRVAGRGRARRAPGGAPASRARRSSARGASSTSPRSPRPSATRRLVEVFPLELRRRLWTDEALAHATRDAACPADDDLRLVDIESYLPGDLLPKADIASMAVSLELRSPFLDHRVVELGLALPPELALGQGGAQAGVRGRPAARDRRPRQDGLRRPARPLVPRGAAAARRATCCSAATTAASSGAPSSKRLLGEHVGGRADHGHRLWCLCMLELWQRNARRRAATRARGRVTPPRAYALVVAACALPRLVVLLHERGAIVSAFIEKSTLRARLLETGTFGYVPGEPSAYTQPLYGWFLIPIYWIAGRHWWSLGLAQIVVAVATALLVYEIGRRVISPAGRPGRGGDRDAPAVPRLARRPRQPRDPRPAARRGDVSARARRGRPPLRLARASRSASSAGSRSSPTRGSLLLPLVLAAYLLWRQAGWCGRARRARCAAARDLAPVGRAQQGRRSAASRSRPTRARSGRRTT